MSGTDSTAIPDPSSKPQGSGSPRPVTALPSAARLAYWSLRRELWENRWVYIVPLIVAGLVLLGFAFGLIKAHFSLKTGAPLRLPQAWIGEAFNFASGVLMLTYLVIAAIYCLGALHGERSDRSILFWKSLPVSDVTTVIVKAGMPIIVLPAITFALIVVTQAVMSLAAIVVLLGKGVDMAAMWAQMSLLAMWAAMFYHLFTVHALYYAPFYGWLLLASGWARRAVFLWAGLPVVAILIIEKLVFDSAAFAHMLLSRLEGGPAAIAFPPHGGMPMQAPTLGNVAAFLASPGLWIGFAVCAVFLAAAVRLRRYQGPI